MILHSKFIINIYRLEVLIVKIIAYKLNKKLKTGIKRLRENIKFCNQAQ